MSARASQLPLLLAIGSPMWLSCCAAVSTTQKYKEAAEQQHEALGLPAPAAGSLQRLMTQALDQRAVVLRVDTRVVQGVQVLVDHAGARCADAQAAGRIPAGSPGHV